MKKRSNASTAVLAACYVLIAFFLFSTENWKSKFNLILDAKADWVETSEEEYKFSELDLIKLYKEELIHSNDAKIKRSQSQQELLSVVMGNTKPWPGISITSPHNDNWNLASYSSVQLTIKNLDSTPLTIFLRADSPIIASKKLRPWITERVTIPAKQTRTINLELKRKTLPITKLVGMQAYPKGMSESGFDPSMTSKLVLFVKRSSQPRKLEIGNLRVVGEYQIKRWQNFTAKQFFPFIDRFGQFLHAKWINKVSTKEDLIAQKNSELKKLAQHPRSAEWGQYGGWLKGPRFKSTNHFRVKKISDQWWLIDPDGYLFWSHGLNVITNSQTTIITDREKYFSNLSNRTLYSADAFSKLKKHQVVKGDYKGHDELEAFDFYQSNLRLKYGSEWSEEVNQLIHQRLASWGLNTIGLWSAPEIKAMKKTPYVDWLYYNYPKIWGRGKYFANMVDMWSPEFKLRLEATVHKLLKLKDDPWCIGVFVDNELPWQDAKKFAAMVLSAPAEQHAKSRLIEYLKTKYASITKFNQSWKTSYSSWAELKEVKLIDENNIPWDVANGFYRMSAEQYYKTVSTYIKKHAPELLYLGSRLNGEFPIPSSEAARYADVVSYNLYRNEVANFSIPNDIDKPIMIGEWHFAANDRGVFGTGLVHAENQNDRAVKYQNYLQGALKNPYIIGAHWFQYTDEPVTGRALDEENHQIGFVSITDTPYVETIDASREVGSKLYKLRYTSE